MTWNFDYTIPSFIVLSFFLFYYFLKPNIIIQSDKYFFSLVIVEFFGFISDVVSSYYHGYSANFHRNLLILLDGFYFIVFIVRHYIISMFFASVFKIKIKKDVPTIITTIITIGIIILILINPFFEYLYCISPNGKYIRGPGYLLIYFTSFVTLILDTYYICRSLKKREFTEIISSIFSVLALLAGSFMKIFFMEYLLVDMFFLFVIVALFLAFQNPEIHTEKKTGLYNQLAFEDLLKECFFKEKKIAILVFCIRNYQEKREIYGSTQIDLALREIGKYFSSSFPFKKVFYLRNGKIAIIEHNSKDFDYIRDKVTDRFHHSWIVNKSEIHLAISSVEMGKEIEFNSIEDIFACFRIAIEEAKRTIDGHICIDKESFDEIAHNTKVSKALNKALLNDDLQLYLQPIIDSKSRKIIAAEALVRLYDEELGIVPPGEFITMAEKNGSIEQLGEQILNKVCIFLKETSLHEKGLQWINVNLSPIQCQNNRLPEKIDTIIDNHTVAHKHIHLEITEDSMIDSQILKRQMNILITDGYDFSLDDFGTGFSNVTRLKTFPFNNIKLDMTIVKEHFNSPDNILPSIVQAFIERGLTVTAEGVETKEMADGLEKMGCDYLQGFYFSKPIPSHEFEKMLLTQNINL